MVATTLGRRRLAEVARTDECRSSRSLSKGNSSLQELAFGRYGTHFPAHELARSGAGGQPIAGYRLNRLPAGRRLLE